MGDRRDFNCGEQQLASWQDRAEAAIHLLRTLWKDEGRPASPRIADLGCGNQRLKPLVLALAADASYTGYDLRPQDPTTVPLDLERELPPPRVDVAFCLGVVEYLRDAEGFLRRLAATADHAIFSLVTSDGGSYTPAEVVSRGWTTHLSTKQMGALAAVAGWRVLAHRRVNEGKASLWLARSVAGTREVPKHA
jgi:hypothetical protein